MRKNKYESATKRIKCRKRKKHTTVGCGMKYINIKRNNETKY